MGFFKSIDLSVLQELNSISVSLRIILAILVGGTMGFERERRNSPAGFRTIILVCLGAAMVMMTNQYIADLYGTGDPGRMGAQVISGIGFLGAGTIMVTGRNQIIGLTTAASLWTAACCGLAIGIGFYNGAILVCIAITFINGGLRKIDKVIREKSNYLDIYVEFNLSKGPFSEFLESTRRLDLVIQNIQLSNEREVSRKMGDKYDMVGYWVRLKSNNKKRSHLEILSLLTTVNGIEFVEEV